MRDTSRDAWCILFFCIGAGVLAATHVMAIGRLGTGALIFRKETTAVSERFSDMCKISRAMIDNPLVIKSYWTHKEPALVPHPAVPHVSSELCQLEEYRQRQRTAKTFELSAAGKNGKEAGSIVCFKAARTGSTFFTKVITKTMKDTNRRTSMLWEPYGNPMCDGDTGNTTEQAISLRTILHQSCTYGQVNLKQKNYERKCTPAAQCEPLPPSDKGSQPVFITSFNPRFINPNIDWNQVFDGIKRPRLFILRRTNLLLMSYSKYHHGGCDTDSSTFDLDALLACAHHYALGDQELSTSVAFVASKAVGHTPHLTLYEDVLANGTLAQNGVMQHLGVNVDVTNIFEENAQTTKKHVKSFCNNADVDCKKLKAGLKRVYPCLLKQLDKCDEGHVWSVPMFSNGTINIRGDCGYLPPLNEGHPIRRLDELYQLPISIPGRPDQGSR